MGIPVHFALLMCSLFLSCKEAQKAEVRQVAEGPNILILVADDLGYSDLGSYGGEIVTPYLDSLASDGIRFSRYHTAPMCSPSRAMLLTGNDNHIAGIGRQALEVDVFGYEGRITERVVTIPQLLKNQGYGTAMSGKWHLGRQAETGPHKLGFEQSFVMLEGVGNHFNSQGIFGNGMTSTYRENGAPVSWPEGNFSTDLYTDKLIGYMDGILKEDKPFFAYAAYTAPHWPLQVSKEYSDKYTGLYDAGYEQLRLKRFEALKKAGLITEDSSLPEMHPSVPAWDSLTEDQKKWEARSMEIYAGMVANLDENIGKIIQHLKDIGEYENTLIIFMSDNGAAGEDYYANPEIRPHINSYYNDDYADMGEANSFISYGPPWAEAASAPFKYFKEHTTNGGILAPMIIRGPGLKNSGEISDEFLSIMDIAPTLYNLLDISYPEEWDSNELYPLMGSSMLPYVSGKSEKIHPDDYVFALEHTGYTMLRKGNWKITNSTHPYKEDNFELFDMTNDLGEQNNLRNQEPGKYQELLSEWRAFHREVRLQLPE